MSSIFPFGVAFFTGAISDQHQKQWLIPGAQRQTPPYAGNTAQRAMEIKMNSGAVAGAAPDEQGFGSGVIQASFHWDFHDRIWIIPTIIQLSNPALNVDIRFRLWNTSSQIEEIEEIRVQGSEVLTFDIGPGDSIRDLEYRTANFQIAPGEPNVDAIVEFITTNLTATLRIMAAISETFNLIPDIPVREEWNFLTDIITNYRGREQRISLRDQPRISQEFDVEIIDQRQRREQFLLLRKNIVVETIIAFYQYGTKVNGFTPAGGNLFKMDMRHTNARVGEFMAIVNTTTEEVILGRVNSIQEDGVILNTASPHDVYGDTGTYVGIPCFSCIVEDGSGITMNTVTGILSIRSKTHREPDLLRPGATRTIDMFDGIPHLKRRPNSGAEEGFSYRRDIIDNETGIRDISSRDYHPTISGDRRFTIQRVSDPDEMDYWRSLFDTVKGAQGSFLLSTYFPDVTIVKETLPVDSGASTFRINEGDAPALLMTYGSWKRLEIEYPNKETTYHLITNSSLNDDGTANITIAPGIPVGDIYRNPVRISYLQRVRATDRIVWSHFSNYSEVSFGIYTTDE